MQGISVSCCYLTEFLNKQRKICILLEMHSCFDKDDALDLRQALHTVSILFLSSESELQHESETLVK